MPSDEARWDAAARSARSDPRTDGEACAVGGIPYPPKRQVRKQSGTQAWPLVRAFGLGAAYLTCKCSFLLDITMIADKVDR